MVGEAMNGLWRSHVEHAIDLLNQAQVAANTPLKTLQYLYEAIVSITRAINELERPEKDD